MTKKEQKRLLGKIAILDLEVRKAKIYGIEKNKMVLLLNQIQTDVKLIVLDS